MPEDNGIIYRNQLSILVALCKFREEVTALKDATPTVPGEYEPETITVKFDDLLKEIRDQEYKQIVLLKTLHQKLSKFVDPYWQRKQAEAEAEQPQGAEAVVGTVLDEAEADWYGPLFKKEATDV